MVGVKGLASDDETIEGGRGELFLVVLDDLL